MTVIKYLPSPLRASSRVLPRPHSDTFTKLLFAPTLLYPEFLWWDLRCLCCPDCLLSAMVAGDVWFVRGGKKISGSDCEVVAPPAASVVVLVLVLVVHASRLQVRVSVRSPPASMHNSSRLPSSTQREYRDCLPVPHVTEHSPQSDHSTSVTQTHTSCTQHVNTSLDTNEEKVITCFDVIMSGTIKMCFGKNLSKFDRNSPTTHLETPVPVAAWSKA
jgi:hypothetical protein